jgi:hypothetical protein
MGGGLLQLVAYGAQDVYLTGNPQITFFKVAYRRHTNFAIEAIEQNFNGTPGYGSRVTCQISRNGDLINRMYLQLTVPTLTAATDYYYNFYGLRLINYVEIEIGGQKIDKHYSHWLYIWNELSLPISKRRGYNEMVGAYGGNELGGNILYIPLEFWFCRNVGLALPLIALQYHEVKINLNFEAAEKCVYVATSPPPALSAVTLWVDYIFLDTDERRRFAQLSHEYLIEQLQFTGQEAVTSTVGLKTKLNFNHPCKELVWFITNDESTTLKKANWFNYTTAATNIIPGTNGTGIPRNYQALKDELLQTNVNYVSGNTVLAAALPSNPIKSSKLILNGNDRFYERPGRYFNLIQPFQHHENIPTNAGINVYSFALKPEEHQPSGTLNMSRIDTALLYLSFEDKTGTTAIDYDPAKSILYVYAVNYNVLRILSGMGGLAYSN